MMSPDDAIAWARMVAPRSATDDDIKRIAGALLEAERCGAERALSGVAGVLDAAASRLRTCASLAHKGREHGLRVAIDTEWQDA